MIYPEEEVAMSAKRSMLKGSSSFRWAPVPTGAYRASIPHEPYSGHSRRYRLIGSHGLQVHTRRKMQHLKEYAVPALQRRITEAELATLIGDQSR